MSRTSPCTGACCSVFYLPYTSDALQSRASHIHEGQYIAAMVEPLTLDAAAQRAADTGIDWPKSILGGSPLEAGEGHLYTCRNWEERTRKCIRYGDRPEMCSAYPYRKMCRHCGWHGAAGPPRG